MTKIQKLFAFASENFAARDKACMADRHLRVQAEALLADATGEDKDGLALILKVCAQGASPSWGLHSSELCLLSRRNV